MSHRRQIEPSALSRAFALSLALSILALGLLAVSPEAHAAVHPDADHGDHVCAITLAAHGFCDNAALAPAASGPSFIEEISFVAPAVSAWSAPEYWHLPAQAPPHGWR